MFFRIKLACQMICRTIIQIMNLQSLQHLIRVYAISNIDDGALGTRYFAGESITVASAKIVASRLIVTLAMHPSMEIHPSLFMQICQLFVHNFAQKH